MKRPMLARTNHLRNIPVFDWFCKRPAYDVRLKRDDDDDDDDDDGDDDEEEQGDEVDEEEEGE